MKTEDIELMRRAAKAANIHVQDDHDGTLQQHPILSIHYECHNMSLAIEWNPLRDRGSCFELLEACQLDFPKGIYGLELLRRIVELAAEKYQKDCQNPPKEAN